MEVPQMTALPYVSFGLLASHNLCSGYWVEPNLLACQCTLYKLLLASFDCVDLSLIAEIE